MRYQLRYIRMRTMIYPRLANPSPTFTGPAEAVPLPLSSFPSSHVTRGISPDHRFPVSREPSTRAPGQIRTDILRLTMAMLYQDELQGRDVHGVYVGTPGG